MVARSWLDSLLTRYGVPTDGTEGTSLTLSGAAAASGDGASAGVRLVAAVGSEDGATTVAGSATAEGEAEAAEDGTASATATTDAQISDDLVVTHFRQETVETGGDDPTAVSITEIEAIEFEAPVLSIEAGEFGAIEHDAWF